MKFILGLLTDKNLIVIFLAIFAIQLVGGRRKRGIHRFLVEFGIAVRIRGDLLILAEGAQPLAAFALAVGICLFRCRLRGECLVCLELRESCVCLLLELTTLLQACLYRFAVGCRGGCR